MTMLTHPGNVFRPASCRSGRPDTADTTTFADFATMKRFCLRALGLLLAGGAVAGIIALKAATFLSRISS
jgi:hypothetical protein